MLKYISAFILAFALAACDAPEQDSTPMPEQPAPEQQQDMPAETQQPDPTAGADISDEELDEYVEASVEAREEQINPMMDQTEMEEILANKDLDYNRYNEIQAAVQQDPQLQQEVELKIQEGTETPQDDF